MTDIVWLLFDLLVNLYQSFLFFFFGFNVINYKNIKLNKWIPIFFGTTILFIVVTSFNYIVAFEGAAAFIYSAIVFLFLLFFTNASVAKKILISLIPTSVMAIVTTFSLNFTSILFQQDIYDLMSISSFYRLFVIFLTMILLSVFLYILQKIIKRNDVFLTKIEWITIISVLAISIIIFLLLYLIVFSGINDTAKIYIACAVILIIITDITVYVLLIQLSKKHKIEIENKLLLQQHAFQTESTNEIMAQYNELQKTRHDFKNTLRVIQTLNREANSQEIDNYINEYLETQNRSVRIISTDNEYVNAIINSKIAIASKENIEITVNTISDIKCSNNIDLCNIIGNLFDNAIEACLLCESNRSIYLEISKEDENTVIFMQNSIRESVLDKNPNLTTTKKNKNRHGYGTKIIQDLANKYNGFADFYEEEGLFCCNVVLSLKS